jgi:hypothetical protein
VRAPTENANSAWTPIAASWLTWGVVPKETPMLELGFLGLLVLALDIYAIFQVMMSRASPLAKVLWTLLILLMPVLGFVIWLIFGPRAPR